MIKPRIVMLPLLAFLATALLGAASAQQAPATTQELLGEMSAAEVGDHAAGLLRDVQSAVVLITGYRDKLSNASAEDSLVLRLQLFEQQKRGMNDLHELVDALQEIETRQAQDELRSRVEAVFDQVTPSVWRMIEDLRAEVAGVRARRQTTAPADRSALEDRVIRVTAHLDTFYKMGWAHLQQMAALGQDTTAARAIYTALLEERADDLSGQLALDLVRADELTKRLKENPTDADVAALSTAVKKSLATGTRSQATILDLMDAAGLDTETYRAQLVTVTRDFSSGLLDAKVTVSLARRALAQFTGWLAEEGPGLVFKLLLFVAILFVGRFLARIVRHAVERSIAAARFSLSQLLQRMIVTTSYNLVLMLALMIGLSQLGISLGPLLAGFGVVGFILGFAMQDSLSNLAAGMMILIYRPYDVGDLVDIAGAFGKVENMSLVSTSILTVDNQKLVVPNSKIWGDVIKNVTDQKIRRVDLVFGISYSDDIAKAEAVLNDILATNERVLDDPEPVVRLHTLNDSSVDFVVRPWVKTEDYWEVHWDVTRAVKMRFDAEGISIPFPQRDVHFYEEKVVRIEGASARSQVIEPVADTDWLAETAPEAEADGEE